MKKENSLLSKVLSNKRYCKLDGTSHVSHFYTFKFPNEDKIDIIVDMDLLDAAIRCTCRDCSVMAVKKRLCTYKKAVLLKLAGL